MRVFVALSGGVDSSVAAALLKERGFDVVGIHMKMWSPLEARAEGAAAPTSSRGWPLTGQAPGSGQLQAPSYQHEGVCRQQVQDRHDAMRVAARLDIPFQTWDFSEEYRRAVVEYMIRGYAAGETPNPDVMCNREIKFGLFLRRALEAGADFVAMGHYVRREIRDQGLAASLYSLVSARDAAKDQSYFLWTLTQEQLQYCLFPIGEYTKAEVRELAREFGLPTAEKPDSQGVCFIGELDLREFLKGYIPERRGRVLTASGRAVGEHEGVEFYTIGQRHGLGIGSLPSRASGPLRRGEGGGIPYYVAEKDRSTNTLVVAEGPYDGALFRGELIAVGAHWISGREPKFPLRCMARIRYRQPLQRCTVEGRRTKDKCLVLFDEPQRAVTPGQSIVFYDAGTVLGGAIIA